MVSASQADLSQKKTSLNSDNTEALTLYQFELCPFCHKVKAGLDLKKIPYEKIEVNPMSKGEMSHIDADENGKKKVPVVQFKEETKRESGAILNWLDGIDCAGPKLIPTDEKQRQRAEEIGAWVDADLTQILPTVLYGTWGDSIKAARLTAKNSNFSTLDNIKVNLFGSVIMKVIAKRILKRRADGSGKNAVQLLDVELDKLENWIGDQQFLCGDTVSIADAATHGALTCIKEFPAFKFVEQRPVIAAWYDRVAKLREDSSLH